MKFKSACAVASAMVLLSVLLVDRFHADPEAPLSIDEDASVLEGSTAATRERRFGEVRSSDDSERALPREQDEQSASLAEAITNIDSPSFSANPVAAVSVTETQLEVPFESSGGVQMESERLLDAEDRDSGWSAGMESRILSELSQISGLAANLIEVDCRTTYCRIRLTLPMEPLPSQPDLATFTEDGGLVLAAAERLGMETVAVLASGGQFETPTFVAYLRRVEGSTTQSVLDELVS